MKKQILIPALSLFLICAITSLLLAAANEATRGPIAELQAQTALAAQQTVLPRPRPLRKKQRPTALPTRRGWMLRVRRWDTSLPPRPRATAD